MPPGEPQPRLDLGDLGAAHRHPVRRRTVEVDHGPIAFLADEGHMRNRHDVAAVHPDEKSGIELGFGLRDRPRAHPLPGAVMYPGIMCVGPDAPDVGGIDKMGSVGALDRKPGCGGGAGRLAGAAGAARRTAAGTVRGRVRTMPPAPWRRLLRRDRSRPLAPPPPAGADPAPATA